MNFETISIIIFLVISLLSCINIFQYYEHKKKNYYVNYFKYDTAGLNMNITTIVLCLGMIVFLLM